MVIHQRSFLCFSFFLLVAPMLTLSATENKTSIDDPIFLACGANGVFLDLDKGVNWTGDTHSKFAPSLNSLGFLTEQDLSVPKYPFSSVRVFTTPYTYQFTLSPGRKFIRLYFYPSNYSTFAASDAFFDVAAGQITLLSNFSAYQVAQAQIYSYLVREYSINVNTSVLNLTFTPTAHAKAYAFINGIEIVSIPDIFDTVNTSLVPILINSDNPVDYTIGSYQGLETVFRLNVGGQSISAKDDSGKLYRSWEDDSIYIYGAGFGVSYAADDNVTIQYTSLVPEYIAPVDVYATARSMGPSAVVNLNYNLSWILTVDAGFYYLLRLHFCEIQYPITSPNQRVFYIYLNNQTATYDADVIEWSGGIGIPIYKDYAVITAGTGQMDLWVELHPNPETKPEFYDAILNGLEVFKIMNENNSLAGLNPVLPSIPFPPSSTVAKTQRKSRAPAIAGGTVGGVVVLLCLLLIVVCICRKNKRREAAKSDGPSGTSPSSDLTYLQPNRSPKTSTTTVIQCSSLPDNLGRLFSIAEIKAATREFDESLLLGVGGFGKVYLGVIDGTTKVATKRANPLSEQGVHEFQTEIETLSKLRHKHVVSMIGYCKEDDEMILVYDYMAHGTLREHLYGTEKPALTWQKRLDICIGAARGLHYLHTGVKHTIIHRDVKSTNILIDEHWVAKVSDFGLSKAGMSATQTHVSTVVKGSFGYIDPEYFKKQRLTEKSDVYSFGVVLFEVLCGQPALDTAFSNEKVSLAERALHCIRQGTIDRIIDPRLKGKIASQCLKKFIETAEKCLSEFGSERPSMNEVLWNLELALQLQESVEDIGCFVAATDGSPLSLRRERGATDSPFIESSTSTTTTTSLSIRGRSLASADPISLSTSDVFSQILNPAGR